MDFFYWFGVLIFLYTFIFFLLIFVSDCDIFMMFAEKFGKPISSLKGKVIWITGASSGIGEHTAIACAKGGAKLVLSAKREHELERVKKVCLDVSNGKLTDFDVMVLPMDITQMDEHKKLFNQVLTHFGKLDILVNNAGRSQRAIWEEIEVEVDKSIFEVNIFGLINLTRICVKYFLKNGGGYVAATSSGAGLMGAPYSGSYTATKHALHGYYDSLRIEKFTKNIDVTLFCPGPTFTNFLQESYTSKANEKFGQATQSTDKRMSGERCGHLFAVALANKIDEAWVAVYPIIPLYYLNRYYPNLLKFLLKTFGPKNFLKLRDSRVSMKVE